MIIADKAPKYANEKFSLAVPISLFGIAPYAGVLVKPPAITHA